MKISTRSPGVARRRPLRARPVDVELDPVVVGVAQVDRLRDAVVGGALDPRVGGGEAPDGARERLAGGEQQREVKEARVPRARRGAGLLDEHEQVLAADAHRREVPVAVVKLQAQRTLVERDRALERGDGQVGGAQAQRVGQARRRRGVGGGGHADDGRPRRPPVLRECDGHANYNARPKRGTSVSVNTAVSKTAARGSTPRSPVYPCNIGASVRADCEPRGERDHAIDDCWVAMVLTIPRYRPGFVRSSSGECVYVQTCGRLWLHAFPQHGPGRTHERPITLEPWQQEIVDRHPGEFVRGLIHSDGCRTINRFRTTLPSGRVAEYAYARYFFSNLSAGHPWPVLRHVRGAWRALDALKPSQRLGRASRQRCQARRDRLREGLTSATPCRDTTARSAG